nr:hypothetical protein [Tanacetum cinerariifolium]
MYVGGRVDILDMVDIDLFIVVTLNMMVMKLGYIGKYELMFYNYLRPLTSLDEGFYALACQEDVRCLATLVRSFELIKVYIEHGVTALDSYLRAPRFKEILEEINDEPAVIASQAIDDVMRQLSFDETELDGEAGFAYVTGSGVDNSGTQEPILAEVGIQEPIVAKVSTQEPIVAEVSTKVPIVEEVGTQEFSVEDVVVEDYVSFREDAAQYNGTNDDDDVDEVFLVDEENEIVEHDVDVYLFEISMDLPFDNIGVNNLVSNDVLEGIDVDVINLDGFDSDHGNDEETNYRKRRLAGLRTDLEEAKDRVSLHFIESKRNFKLYKNDGVRIRARCDRKVHVFTISQCDGPTGPNRRMEPGPSGSSGPTTRSKKRKNTSTNAINQASSSGLYAYVKRDLCHWVLVNLDIQVKAVQDQLQRELESTNPNTTVKITVERNNDLSLPTRVFQRIYVCLGALKLGFRACRRDWLGLDGAFMKDSFPGQVLVAVGLDSNNRIYPLAYALVEAESRAKSDLLLNNICEVFNGKIVEGRDKLVRIVNVQGVIDKCTSLLTHTVTIIMESIKKEAHLMKELIGIPCKHVVTDCWNMALNDRATPPPETWVNPCYWLSTWKETYSHKVGRPRNKRKRSKHEDEPIVKDGGSGAGVVIGLSTAAGEGGQGGAGVASQDSNIELLIPTPWFDESKNEKRTKRWREEFEWKISLFKIDLTFDINAFDLNKGTDVMKNVCKKEVPSNNNIGKQISDFVDMPSEAVEQGTDANVPDEIDGAKGEHVPNHVVKKGNLEFMVCKEIGNPGVNKLVDKGRPLKRKMVYAE